MQESLLGAGRAAAGRAVPVPGARAAAAHTRHSPTHTQRFERTACHSRERLGEPLSVWTVCPLEHTAKQLTPHCSHRHLTQEAHITVMCGSE